VHSNDGDLILTSNVPCSIILVSQVPTRAVKYRSWCNMQWDVRPLEFNFQCYVSAPCSCYDSNLPSQSRFLVCRLDEEKCVYHSSVRWINQRHLLVLSLYYVTHMHSKVRCEHVTSLACLPILYFYLAPILYTNAHILCNNKLVRLPVWISTVLEGEVP
jgi:hypothetical protein